MRMENLDVQAPDRRRKVDQSVQIRDPLGGFLSSTLHIDDFLISNPTWSISLWMALQLDRPWVAEGNAWGRLPCLPVQ